MCQVQTLLFVVVFVAVATADIYRLPAGLSMQPGQWNTVETDCIDRQVYDRVGVKYTHTHNHVAYIAICMQVFIFSLSLTAIGSTVHWLSCFSVVVALGNFSLLRILRAFKLI